MARGSSNYTNRVLSCDGLAGSSGGVRRNIPQIDRSNARTRMLQVRPAGIMPGHARQVPLVRPCLLHGQAGRMVDRAKSDLHTQSKEPIHIDFHVRGFVVRDHLSTRTGAFLATDSQGALGGVRRNMPQIDRSNTRTRMLQVRPTGVMSDHTRPVPLVRPSLHTSWSSHPDG